MHHFEITMGETCSDTVVKMDGRVVTGLKSFIVDCGIHDVPRITFELEMAKTSLMTGVSQVWVRDDAVRMSESLDTANHRADDAEVKTGEAEHRADAAEARADAAEAMSVPPGGTLAYIVPVDGTTLETKPEKGKKK